MKSLFSPDECGILKLITKKRDKMEEFKLGKLRYIVRYPEGFSKDDKRPALIFLHGAGTRGNDMEKLRDNVFFELIEKHQNFPFVIFAPLCTENTWFDLFEHLKELVKTIAKLSYVDEKRIYLTGNSMGGYGTWQLAMSMPEYFAAIAPVCGGGMYWNAWRLANLPVWAFHGEKDGCVLPEESKKMIDIAKQAGTEARLTLYPEAGHDAWTPTYSNPEVFEWMLSHESNCKVELKEKYSDSKIYG